MSELSEEIDSSISEIKEGLALNEKIRKGVFPVSKWIILIVIYGIFGVASKFVFDSYMAFYSPFIIITGMLAIYLPLILIERKIVSNNPNFLSGDRIAQVVSDVIEYKLSSSGFSSSEDVKSDDWTIPSKIFFNTSFERLLSTDVLSIHHKHTNKPIEMVHLKSVFECVVRDKESKKERLVEKKSIRTIVKVKTKLPEDFILYAGEKVLLIGDPKKNVIDIFRDGQSEIEVQDVNSELNEKMVFLSNNSLETFKFLRPSVIERLLENEDRGWLLNYADHFAFYIHGGDLYFTLLNVGGDGEVDSATYLTSEIDALPDLVDKQIDRIATTLDKLGVEVNGR